MVTLPRLLVIGRAAGIAAAPARMRRLLGGIALSALLLAGCAGHAGNIEDIQSVPAAGLGWPEITREHKPWTRWWWPGNAVDPASLTRQLEQMAAAGIGGVEIPGVGGALARYSWFTIILPSSANNQQDGPCVPCADTEAG